VAQQKWTCCFGQALFLHVHAPRLRQNAIYFFFSETQHTCSGIKFKLLNISAASSDPSRLADDEKESRSLHR
jgi:hypothetical protein